MTSTPKFGPEANDGPREARQHDMGGADAGKIDTEDHGLLFWEKQANGMRMVLVGKELLKLDEMRRAAEDLPDYYRLSYFERTTKSIRNLLLEKGVFSEQDLAEKMSEVRERFETEPVSRGAI
jgi:nitrile hydratase